MSDHARYYRLREDVRAGNWYLGDPWDGMDQEVEDIWEFAAGRPIRPPDRLVFPLEEPGRALDFSTAGVGGAPVVHVKVANLFAELAPNDVQLFPVEVTGQPDQYVMLIATKLVRCIDDAATEDVLYWKPEDERPDKLGQYRSVYGMRIDRSKVGDAKVFRTWGWEIALIVSEDIKAAMEAAKVTGAKFEEV
ncbi:imm11 family protein [Myxococcus stipitatus]|uniref:imm11 family protein n=1 Tax=Myxococcus stipitatus TaxID=83455 RepID=UPI0030D231F4